MFSKSVISNWLMTYLKRSYDHVAVQKISISSRWPKLRWSFRRRCQVFQYTNCCKLQKIHLRHCLFKTQIKDGRILLKTQAKSRVTSYSKMQAKDTHVSFKDAGPDKIVPHSRCRPRQPRPTQDASQIKAPSYSRRKPRQSRIQRRPSWIARAMIGRVRAASECQRSDCAFQNRIRVPKPRLNVPEL